jgi:O-acetyl-ADP-ribose deacetylase (regulator of RNase III)
VPVRFVNGDIFESEAQALCNAVNCVCVMGGGLAAAFRQRFPAMYREYQSYCNRQKLFPGGVHVFTEGDKTIFNVATKRDWIADSQYEWVASGLKNIAVEARKLGITTVAVPALGCGLGMLDWDRVKKMIEEIAAEHWDGLDVEVYEPLV